VASLKVKRGIEEGMCHATRHLNPWTSCMCRGRSTK